MGGFINLKIILIAIFLIILISLIPTYFLFFKKIHKPILTYSSILEKNPELKEVNVSILKSFWRDNNCTIWPNSSIISFAHIQKSNSGYNISCEQGFYDRNFKMPMNLPVYSGYVKECSQQAAILIDAAVREPYNCIWPNRYTIPENLTDYYVFSLGCKWLSNDEAREFLSTDSSKIRPVQQCFQKILTPAENSSRTCCKSFAVGVLDLKNNQLYASRYFDITLTS